MTHVTEIIDPGVAFDYLLFTGYIKFWSIKANLVALNFQ